MPLLFVSRCFHCSHLSSKRHIVFFDAGDDLVDLEADLRQPTFGDSFVAIQNATNSTALRKTHRALSICNDELGLLGEKSSNANLQ